MNHFVSIKSLTLISGLLCQWISSVSPQVAILCYETVSLQSYDRAMFWADRLKQNEPSCRVFLVATKIDLLECDGIVEEVSEEEALTFKQKIGEF